LRIDKETPLYDDESHRSLVKQGRQNLKLARKPVVL
jgi:hypothetical protein